MPSVATLDNVIAKLFGENFARGILYFLFQRPKRKLSTKRGISYHGITRFPVTFGEIKIVRCQQLN